MLLTAPSGLSLAVSVEIARVLKPGGTVYVLGGPLAVSPIVDDQVTSLGFVAQRLAGADRFGTAVAIAGALGDPSTVFEATGLDFPDGLSAGAAAAEAHGVVLLTNGSAPAAATVDYLDAHPGQDYAIGGPAAQADPSATPLAGPDRYATAIAGRAERFFASPNGGRVRVGRGVPRRPRRAEPASPPAGARCCSSPGRSAAPVAVLLPRRQPRRSRAG